MSRPEVLIHNIETNEIIVREMNDEELAQFEQDGLDYEQEKLAVVEAQAKKAAAEAKLAALGLNADDLKSPRPLAQSIKIMTRLCAAGVQLREQIDDDYPDRDRKSDGWIADARHLAKSTSDHIPRDGIVRAIDIDSDLSAHKEEAYALVEKIRRLAKNGDKRIKYIIFDGKIMSPILVGSGVNTTALIPTGRISIFHLQHWETKMAVISNSKEILMRDLKKAAESWGKAFLAAALATYLAVGYDPAAIANAALVSVLPSIINWLNPNYERYGKVR
jgi:hypothetical protein